MSKIEYLMDDSDHEDFIDDDYQYKDWCHYSNLPSPTAYDDGEAQDIE